MDDWLKEIKPSEIPEHMAPLVDAIGIDAAVRLMEQVGGACIYIPKADALTRIIRDKHIRDEYNGYNAQQLALKYGISVCGARLCCCCTRPIRRPLRSGQ